MEPLDFEYSFFNDTKVSEYPALDLDAFEPLISSVYAGAL